MNAGLAITRGYRRDLLWVTAIGLALSAFWLALLEQPSYMDAYYYAIGGQELAAGHGFNVPVIWQYLSDPAGLPASSHTYWMPLPSLLAALGYRLGDSFLAARVPFWLLGGSLPTLAYAINHRISGRRWSAWAAALFTAAGGFYAAFLGQTTTFAPFAWSAAGGLLALGLASGNQSISRARAWWLVAGLAAGLAHLTRADGLLILLVGLALWLAQRKEAGEVRDVDSERRKPDAGHLLLLLLGYFTIMLPWFIRNQVQFGRPLAVEGVQGIFLTTYDDLFAYDRNANLADFLDWGLDNILRSRIEGTWVAVQSFLAIPGLIFLTPFIFIAFVVFYRRPACKPLLRPFFWFAVAIFVSSSWLFTFPGMRGTLFHASIALWPLTMALAPEGIRLAVEWVARRRPHWRPEKAAPTFSALFILLAVVMSLFIGLPRLTPAEDPEIYARLRQSLPDDAIVMVGNAPAFYYHTGLMALNVPNEPLNVVLQAADRYTVTHLILDKNRPRPLADLYLDRFRSDRLLYLGEDEGNKLYEIRRPNG